MFHDYKINENGIPEDEHYHWFNLNRDKTDASTNEAKYYFDRYGKICEKGTPQSHLAPKDKKYNWRRQH